MNRKKVNWSKAGKKAWATRRKNALLDDKINRLAGRVEKRDVPLTTKTKKSAKSAGWRKKVDWSKAGRKAWRTRRARYYTIK